MRIEERKILDYLLNKEKSRLSSLRRYMMIDEHENAVLTVDLPSIGLMAGSGASLWARCWTVQPMSRQILFRHPSKRQ